MAWRNHLFEIMETHGWKRADGKPTRVRDRTKNHRSEVLLKLFNRLHNLGFRLENLSKLEERHVSALVQDAYHDQNYKANTLKDELSVLRIFGSWIGKPELVKEAEFYLPEVGKGALIVVAAAEESKSWTEHGIDVIAKIREADELDERFGLMLRLMLALGLRRMEVLACTPWKNAREGNVWRVYPDEAKGHRPRVVQIETEEQRRVVEFVKSKLKKTERMRWVTTPRGQEMTLRKAYKRFSHLMGKLGITKALSGATGHGLRATYIENHAIVAGFVPPTLGGDGSELEKDELKAARGIASQNLGHARISITNAYMGPFPRNAKFDKDRLKKAIAEALDEIARNGGGEAFDEAFRDDCQRIALHLRDRDIAITLPQVSTLWRRYSARHNSVWVTPTNEQEIEGGLFVAATMHRREKYREE